MTGSEPFPDPGWLDGEPGPVVRPYAMTHGRTRPSHGTFDLITIIVATHPNAPTDGSFRPEHAAIIQVCQRPTSVAEIASHLDLPVGTVRVVLGDLLAEHLIRVRPPAPAADIPSEGVFKAVLDGLRSL
jgi:hypothetical protein